MINLNDVRSTTQAKSDQLNADDLVASDLIATVTSVTAGSTQEQPVFLHLEGYDGKPYKPCLSMRRILIALWGQDATQWPGGKLHLYNEASVKWAGKEIGGIRIRAITGIDKPYNVMLATSRGKRSGYTVQPLVLPPYPQESLDSNLAAWAASKATPAAIINKIESSYTLTEQQKTTITTMREK